jgi:toxin YoeB
MRNLTFTPEAWDDYHFWTSQDKKTFKKIDKLIADIQRSPFDGIGKPEPLKENFSGFWSRHIDEKNRLIYNVTDNAIQIIACRFHY